MIHDITSYIYLLIYILLWFFVCYKHYKKAKFSSGTIVILSYLIYGILALLLYSNKYFGRSYDELKLFPFIYLFVMLYIFLLPVFKYEKSSITRVCIPSNILVQTFLLIYSFSAIVTIPESMGSLREGISLLLSDSSGGSELYNEAYNNYVVREKGISGVFGLISIIYNTFSDIAKFMFFYYLTLNNKKKIFLILFCIVFIVDVLYPLSQGGRTPAVMNIFSILMAGTLFYPFYSCKIKKIVKKCSLILLIIVSIPFMALTISRFGEREYGTSGGMLSYAGQAPLNFNTKSLDAGGIRNGDRTINLFKQFLFNDVPRDVSEVRAKYRNLKINDSIFSTYVGDFVLDYGPIGAFIIFLLLFIWFNKSIRIYNNTIPFYSLLLIYFILCIAMQGGMYLFYYAFMNNIKIIALIFMYVIFYIDYNSRKTHNYLYIRI